MTGLYTRAFALDDIRIRAGGDGRTVEAYASIFNVTAEVRDQDGHYKESIDTHAYDKTLRDLAPKGSRASWRCQVLYHHGMTLHGTPSERGSVPIAVPQEIRPDGRGLLVVDHYLRTDLADEVLENIRAGSITGYSFTGRMIRTNPPVPRGGFRARAGVLPTVRRMEIALREYGPTPFPIYADAAIVGMRAMLAGLTLPGGEDDDLSRAGMSTAEINDLPDSAFGYIGSGGSKDSQGKTVPRSLRHFPVHDEAHARNALQRAPQSPFGGKAWPKILKACKRFGIEVSDDDDERQARATPQLGSSHLDTPYLGAVAEEPPVTSDAHSARSAIGWAATRAAIRERAGVRHAKEEEKRGSSRAA